MPNDLRTFCGKFLASVAPAFDGQSVVVGRSGFFSLEGLIQATAKPAALHCNDMDFVPCMLGRWVSGKPVDFEVIDPEFEWLAPYLDTDDKRIAALVVLMNMVGYRRQNNPYMIRMWANYQAQFEQIVGETLGKLANVQVKVASFTDGRVLPHFEAHANTPDAIFACYAPGYSGPRESYRALDDLVNWDDPDCDQMDDDEADRVIAFLKGRRYLWFDNRELPGLTPVVIERRGKNKDGVGSGFLFLYSNVTARNAYYARIKPEQPLTLPLADATTTLTRKTKIRLERISTKDLGHFKDAFLGKNIKHGTGTWAFAVFAGEVVIGFLEYSLPRFSGQGWLFLNADFPVSNTRYKRLSKLISMLAVSGETRRIVERLAERKADGIMTMAFTERAVSMKYRGVLEVARRGQTESGQKYINYRGAFNELNWKQTLGNWYQKNAEVLAQAGGDNAEG